MDCNNINIDVTISVLMITYNHEPFLKEAIEGILMQQTDYSVELVIGEDCSTDNTLAICEKYQIKHPDIIRLLTSKRNIGMMGNFIRTIKACKGKYIAFCEGDDYWTDPYKLQKQVDFLEANPGYSICGHNVDVNVEYEKAHQAGWVGDLGISDIKEGSYGTSDLLKGLWIGTASIVFRKEMLSLPKWIKRVANADQVILQLLSLKGDLFIMRKKMAAYRRHDGGIHASDNHNYKSDWIYAKRIFALKKFNKHSRYKYNDLIKNRVNQFNVKRLGLASNGNFKRMRILFTMLISGSIKSTTNFKDLIAGVAFPLAYKTFAGFRKKLPGI